jgi:syndecan 1
MNGRAPSVTARTLVARSRRPAQATTAAALMRLAGGTALAPPRDSPAPTSVAAAGPAPAPALAREAPTSLAAAPQTPVPQTPVPRTPAPHAAALRAAALEAVAPTPAPEAPVPLTAPAGQHVRYQVATERAYAESPPAGSSALSVRPAAASAPTAPAQRPAPTAPGPPPAPVPLPAAVRTADTGRPPRDDATPAPVPPAAAAAPAARDRIPRPEGLTRITGATPFVKRARRPARSVASPDTGTVRPAARPQPQPESPTAETPTPGQTPAAARTPAPPRAAPAHPPVTIGEIHVHVTEPAAAAADPFSLLAPYAQGLTARRDGAW